MTQLAAFFPDARLTELGKIKIGGKSAKTRTTASGTTWRAPEKHDYFTVTTMHRNAAGDLVEDASLMEQLAAKYGDPADGKLRSLPIRVLSNDIDDIMQTAYVWYGSRSVGARSDGQTVTWFNDPRSMARLPEPRTEDWRPDMLDLADSRGNKLFKMHTNFSCVIAAQEAKWGGVYKFRTTSVISSKQLYQSLMLLHQLTGGILVGMPLMLMVRPMIVSPQGKATTVYVVHVELRGPDLQALQLQAIEQAKFQLENRQRVQHLTGEYRRLLLPPGHETPDDAKDINEEFQPETAGEVATLPPAGESDPFWDGLIGNPTQPAAQEPAAPALPVIDAEPVDEQPSQPTPQPVTPAQKRQLQADLEMMLTDKGGQAEWAVGMIQAACKAVLDGRRIETADDLEAVKAELGKYNLEDGTRIPDAIGQEVGK